MTSDRGRLSMLHLAAALLLALAAGVAAGADGPS